MRGLTLSPGSTTQTLTTNEHFDPDTIHRFDCTEEHMGGAGGASEWLDQEGSEFGDLWLGVVAAEGKGKAPKTAEMKQLLQHDENNIWRLEATE